MPTPPRSNPWRRLRHTLRWCRIGLLLLLLVCLLGALYLNQVGLPGFLKAPVLAELHRRGVDFQYERLAWRWHRGFVAQTATLRAIADPRGPRAQAAEVVLSLDWKRLVRSRALEFAFLHITDGRIVLPLEEPGQAPDECALDRVNAAVRFLPGAQWEIENLQASFGDATFRANGTVANADELTAWFHPRAGKDRPPSWRAPLRQWIGLWKSLRIAGQPELRLRFHGDARHPQSFVGVLKGQIDGAELPQLGLHNLRWTVELNQPVPSAGGCGLVLRLNVDEARLPWADLRDAALSARTALHLTNPIPTQVDWELTAHQVQAPRTDLATVLLNGHSQAITKAGRAWRTTLTLESARLTTAWGSAQTNRIAATFEHSLDSLLPAPIDLAAALETVQTPWGQAADVRIDARAQSPAVTLSSGERSSGALGLNTSTNAGARLVSREDTLQGHLAPSLSHPMGEGERDGVSGHGLWESWETLNRIAASWHLTATNLQSPRLALNHLALAGNWSAPCLTLSNLHAGLYGGALQVSTARVDLATREVDAQFASDFDPHALAPLAGQRASDWLEQFHWARPPRVEGTVRAQLPPWTNRPPDWARRALPAVAAEARIWGADAAYRDMHIDRGELSLSLSNQVLRLRDFHVVRPEGDADLAYDLHTGTREFRWRLRANLDPQGTGTAINRNAPRVLSLFGFTGPAAVAGEVWGRWGPDKEVGFALGGVATNFTFRGEQIDEARAGVRMANGFLAATNVSFRTGAEWIRAPGVGVDFVESWAYLTNAEAVLDPPRFARLIGSNLVKTLSPYRFDRPPRIQAEGRVPVRGPMDEADMWFTVAGGPFHYWRFNVPVLEGRVHWEGDRVTLTNVLCDFYGGRLDGRFQADLHPEGNADLAFRAAITNVNLQPLVLDAIATTNRIEGTVHGALEITRANTADWGSWNGSGRFFMRDGLLWNLPILRILSPALNAIVPGLGNNRARAATGSFTITNSVMQTDDLEIVAHPVRLAYHGTLDFDWNVRARVEAEVIPGAPLIGPILNIVFAPLSKALVFRISGTLGAPELEPLLVPKFLLPVVRPFQTIRGLISSPSAPGDTPPPRTDKP